MDNEIVENIRRKFSSVHPLIFQRSWEKAKTPGELFDLLDTLPPLPFVWDAEAGCWRTVANLVDPKTKA
jgi:hypothetical protein